ncbi:MAG: tRNA-intron lyase [Halobacterium sp.]
MNGTLRGDAVRVGGNARQRFYDARGYGRPLDGNAIELAPVEAAHLLFRGDLDAVECEGADGEARALDFRAFVEQTGVALAFVVYKDLRERGFYLSPAREGWVDDPEGVDFVVYPRGKGPEDGVERYRVRAIGERESVAASTLGDLVLAIVDEDGELTYLETSRPVMGGTAAYDPPSALDATLLEDRVFVWDAPESLYRDGFYGRRLEGRSADGGPLQLSLVEAAHLAQRDALSIPEGDVVACGREVEGARFDRRLRAYASLRAAGCVPKSGFKFGADFRTYDAFESVDDLGHSDDLVRVVSPDHVFLPRDLSLDVRLAGGVRKRMVFALTDVNEGIDWLSLSRLTP